MELLDRYVKTVGKYLPKAQRDDIIRELSDNIRSQMEDREAELGRVLNEVEEEAILKQIGNPLVVAGRYQKDQRTFTFGRQLIGPALFPQYARVVSINLVVSSVISVAVAFVLGYWGRSFILPAIAFQLLVQFSIITAIFIAAETSLTRNANRWNPWNPSTPVPEHLSRFSSLVELVVNLVFFLWWWTIPSHVPGVLSSIGSPLQIGPGLYVLYVPMLVLSLGGIALAGFNLVRPQRTAATNFARPALTGLFVAVLCLSLIAGDWIVVGATAGPMPQLLMLVEKINHWIRTGLIISAVVAALLLFLEVRRATNRGNPFLAGLNAVLSNSL